MSFTDDDLRRLKEHMQDSRYADLLNLKGLLARLETAEEIVKYIRIGCGHDRHCNCPPDDHSLIEKYVTWHKAAGRDR